MEALITALTTGFTTISTDMLSAIGSITPVLLPVMGSFMIVGAGIRIAKRVAGR